MPITIKELADRYGLRGPSSHRTAEPGNVTTMPVIDNSNQFSSNIRTSVDCYVSGQYVQRNGKVIEVTQRYTIFVTYNKDTQQQTLNDVRQRIIRDFEQKYGSNFNIANVWVQPIPVPAQDTLPGTPPGTVGDIQMYGGSRLFREMTRFEKARFEIKTQREIADTNIDNIRDRYGLKRK